MPRSIRGLLMATCLVIPCATVRGGDVVGRVEMPESCSPSVSPAVVRLDPVDPTSPAVAGTDEPRFLDQRGMRFEPRVVALRSGQMLRIGNADSELHNIHIRAPREDFNQVVAPGGTIEYVPREAGVLKVLCDVHSHMRAYLVVGGSPWVAACTRTGDFRFRDVPEGRYRLQIWHELGQPMTADVVVRDGQPLHLGTLVAMGGANPAAAGDRAQVCKTGCEPWPLVIDRLSLTLAESLEASRRPETSARAVPLAQDARYRDFEASGMKMAMRLHLGHDRALRAEDLLREIADATGLVVAGKAEAGDVLDPTRQAVLNLAQASRELNRKGVTERSKVFAATSPAFWVEEPASARSRPQRAEDDRPSSLASLPRFLRDGSGAVLLLAVLFALAARSSERGRAGWLLVGGGLVAAIALSVLIGLTGRDGGDLIEGVMLLAAAGLLFHTAQQIVARFGAWRRQDLAPENRSTGLEGRALVPLGLAAILVVARDATATVNLSRSLVARGETSAVLIGFGVLAGLFAAVVLSASVLRARALLGLTGVLVLALAIAFAGGGVSSLQAAGILRSTELAWAARGLLDLGFRPNAQVVAMQAVLVAGAIASLGLAARARLAERGRGVSTPPAPG